MIAVGGYLLALAATLALEVAIASSLAPKNVRAVTAWTAVWANLATHPLATWLSWQQAGFPILEVAVIAVEALCFRLVARLSMPRAVAIALVANAVTIVVGIVCAALAHW